MIINMNGAKAPETPSPVYQEKTVTPETLPVVIGADQGYDGLSQVTVNPDPQLKAENIRSGKTVFGVEGSYGRQFVGGNINVGGGAGATSDKEFIFNVDFSEHPRQLTFNYPADIPQGMLLDPTTVKCNRPDFLIAAKVPEHLIWLGIRGTAPWHMFNTQRGHKPDSFPYVITPAKEYRMMEDPINGTKMGNTFTLTYDEEVVNAPDNLTPENIKAGVTIAGIMGTYEPQPSEVTLETVVTTPTSFPTVVTPSVGYDGLSRVTVHSPDNLTAENIKAGVSIAGVTGIYSGGEVVADAEAEFFKKVCATTPHSSLPIEAPEGVISSSARMDRQYLFSGHYIGPGGVFIPNNAFLDSTATYMFKGVYQYSYQSGVGYIEGGPINVPTLSMYMFNEAKLLALPTGSWQSADKNIPAGCFSSAAFINDITIDAASDITGLSGLTKGGFMNVSQSSLKLTIKQCKSIGSGSGYTAIGGTSTYPLELVMLQETPPTLEGSNRLSSNISSITVPVGCLEAYQTATNWSKHADKMVEASA